MLSTIKFLYILLIVCLTKPSYTFATYYPRSLTLSPTFIFPYFSCLPKGGERRVGERGEVGEKGGEKEEMKEKEVEKEEGKEKEVDEKEEEQEKEGKVEEKEKEKEEGKAEEGKEEDK